MTGRGSQRPRAIIAAIGLLGGLPLVIDATARFVLLGLPGMVTGPSLLAFGLQTAGGIANLALVSWLVRRPFDRARYPRFAAWCFAAAGGSVAVNLVLMGIDRPASTMDAIGWLLWAVAFGTFIGMVVGSREARAIDRAVDAERSAVEHEIRAEQRDLFEYVNGLIRHEVLNNAQVMQGRLALLLDRVDEPTVEDGLRVVHRRSEDMVDVVRDVRLLTEATNGETELEVVDVEEVLRSALRDLRETYPSAETTLSVDGEARAVADELVGRVFSNLLANAVEHSDHVAPSIEVDVETTPDLVSVRIADDGPGIPEDVRASLFEYTTDSHGVGLYLVDVLVSRYDGTVELTETGPDGSVFTVELPRVAEGDADDVSERLLNGSPSAGSTVGRPR